MEWTAKSLYPEFVAHKMIFSAYDLPQDAVYRSALPENMSLAMKETPIDVTAVMTGTMPGPASRSGSSCA